MKGDQPEMSFNDVLKKSFLNNFSPVDAGVTDMLVVLGITLLLALYLFFIYRILIRKEFYNRNFNLSLVALALITAAIIVTIQSSVVISLGMVGALSIVRFRTAIKEPMDLVFLFWSISLGIICGAGLYHVAIVTTLVVTAAVFGLNLLPAARTPLMLVVEAERKDGVEQRILEAVKATSKYYGVKSRSASNGQLNMVVELRAVKEDEVLERVCAVDGVGYVSVVRQGGER